MGDLRQDYLLHQDIHFADPVVMQLREYRHRRSPVIVTIDDPKITWVDIQKMLELGVNGIRFKASHCTTGEKIRLLGQVNKAVEFLSTKHGVASWPISTCIELKTAIVKTGVLEETDSFITLKEGHKCKLTYDLELVNKCNAHVIFVDNPFIAVDVEVGNIISISQDDIVLKCIKIIDEKSIKCIVIKSGPLTNMSHVTVRGKAKSSRPLVTKKDLHAVKFALQYEVDIILVNYARKPETIRKIKEYIGNKVKNKPLILAGVCGCEGLLNIDELIKVSDGIVLSREFLAYELDETMQFRLLQIQRVIGAKCQEAGKPYFISGEVFRQALTIGEFFENETSDITNAVLDGATGFILRACSDIEVLAEVLRAMNELCCAVEPLTNGKTDFWRTIDGIRIPVNAAEACAVSCAAVAHQNQARIIVVPTVTGHTAKTLTWLRPAALVMTVSTKAMTSRRLLIYRSILPLTFKGEKYKNWYKAVEARIQFAVEYAVTLGLLKLGDNYVTLQRGSEDSAFCDMVRLWKVTISKKTTVECPDETVPKTFTSSRKMTLNASPVTRMSVTVREPPSHHSTL